MSSQPKSFVSNPTFRKKFRFIASEAEVKGADPITTSSLANLMVIGTNSSGGASATACRLFSAVRLVSIEIWGDINENEYSPVQLEWYGDRSPNVTKTAYGSVMAPAHIAMQPPRNSLAAFWINPSSPRYLNAPIFGLSCTLGAIVDIVVDFQLLDYDGQQTQGSLLGVVGGPTMTPGLVFYNTLDNTAVSGTAATGTFVPAGQKTFVPATYALHGV